MPQIKFEDYKQRITAAISTRLHTNLLPKENGFTLIEGFITQPLSKEISGSLVIGGPSIPLVAIVGNTTGQVYYFALKALLPEINF